MTTDRMNYLLLEYAKEISTRNNGGWTKRDNVTSDEAEILVETIGQIIAGYARADEETRDAIALYGVVDNPEVGKFIKGAVKTVHARKELAGV